MNIKLLSDGARVPSKAKEGDAGFDLYTPKDYTVMPGRNLLPIDIAIELDKGTEAQIRPRSGFSLKGVDGVVPGTNTFQKFDADALLGTIDEGYRGNVGVIIKSYEKTPFIIKAGTRIAQMVISTYCNPKLNVTEHLSDTERSNGGFGHSGV